MSDYDQSVLNKSRSDKFILVMNLPTILKSLDKKLLRTSKNIQGDKLQFSVFGTIVPEIQVPAVEARYSGSTINISSHARPTYAPITLSFKIDNQFDNYWVLFTWLNLLRDQQEGVAGIVDADRIISDRTINLADYSSNISVFGLDEFNQPRIEFKYIRAFPTSLAEINYDYTNPEQISSACRFAFHEMNVNLC